MFSSRRTSSLLLSYARSGIARNEVFERSADRGGGGRGALHDAAWPLIGYIKNGPFNLTVVPNFYDTTFSADPGCTRP